MIEISTEWSKRMKTSYSILELNPGTFFLIGKIESFRNKILQYVGKYREAGDRGERILLVEYDTTKQDNIVHLLNVDTSFRSDSITLLDVRTHISFSENTLVSPSYLKKDLDSFALYPRDGSLDLVKFGDPLNEFGEFISVTRGKSFSFPRPERECIIPVEVNFEFSYR